VTSYSLLREKLSDVLTTLTERERKILEMRFGLLDGYERTLEEIGKMYNVTPRTHPPDPRPRRCASCVTRRACVICKVSLKPPNRRKRG